MNIEQTNKHLCNLVDLLVDSQNVPFDTIKFAVKRVSVHLPAVGSELFKARLRSAADELRVHAERCRSAADELDRLSGGFNG